MEGRDWEGRHWHESKGNEIKMNAMQKKTRTCKYDITLQKQNGMKCNGTAGHGVERNTTT